MPSFSTSGGAIAGFAGGNLNRSRAAIKAIGVGLFVRGLAFIAALDTAFMARQAAPRKSFGLCGGLVWLFGVPVAWAGAGGLCGYLT